MVLVQRKAVISSFARQYSVPASSRHLLPQANVRKLRVRCTIIPVFDGAERVPIERKIADDIEVVEPNVSEVC
jgi:hypothetical protein